MTKQAKIILGSIGGLLLLAIISIALSGKDPQDEFENFENSFENENFSYEDLMKSQEGDMFEVDDQVIDPVATTHNEINEDSLNLLNEIIEQNSVYENENDLSTLEIQKAIQDLEMEKQRLSQNSGVIETNEKVSKSDSREQKLEYLRRLRESRKYYTQENAKDKGSYNNKNEIQFYAAVYNNQYLQPGERLELILPQDTRISGKLYPKGTAVFAYITISQSRVLLDINNIDGDRMNITTEDINDHREGMYSKRAANLWRMYKDKQKENVESEVEQEISSRSGSNLLGVAVQDLNEFFKGRRLRKEEKLLFNNGDLVILKTPKL